jgi:hypothetical protein
VKDSRTPRALLFAALAVALVIVAIPLLRPLWHDDGGVNVDVGPVAGLRLHDAWVKVADSAGIVPDSAKYDDLEVDYTPEGLLVHLLLQAWAPGGTMLSVGYEAYGLPDLAGRSVNISGGVVRGVTGMPPQTYGLVDAVLSAIDRVGPAAVLAKLPDVGATGYCSFAPLPRQGYPDAIPAGASAYIWNETEFTPLAAGDTRRTYDDHHIYLLVAPVVTTRDATPPTTGRGMVSTTMTARPLTPAYFVVPSPGAPTNTTEE